MTCWCVRRLATAVLCSLISFSQFCFAAEIYLTWNPNPEADISGYKVYATDLLTTNRSTFDVGNELEASFEAEPGHSYAFAVTAYNLAGLESLPSAEVRYNAPIDVLSVSWDPSAYAVAEYRLFFGLVNQPAEQISAGKNTSLQVGNLERGSNYFFYVEAYNLSGQKVDSWQQVTLVLPTIGELGGIFIHRLNLAPLVTITSPAATANLVAPATITISANASDLDGGIRSVDFYSGSTRLASDVSAPYSYSWAGVPAGTYQLAAVAIDTLGASTRTTVNVTVKGALPLAPTSLSGTSTETSVQLNWLHSSADETGFRVYRSTGSGFTLVATLASNTLGYLDSGLTAGTSYSYRVVSYNSAGESAPATLTLSTKSAAPVAPPTPANVTASPVNSSIVIGWNASVGATQYQVQRATSASGPFQLIGTPQVNQWTDSQVTLGTTYFYRVIASADGISSAPSATVSAAIQGSVPLAPSYLTGSSRWGRVTLSWRDNASNETSFNVERSLDGVSFSQIALLGANSTGYVDRSIVSRRKYYYRVSAANSAGKSVSNTVSVRTR